VPAIDGSRDRITLGEFSSSDPSKKLKPHGNGTWNEFLWELTFSMDEALILVMSITGRGESLSPTIPLENLGFNISPRKIRA
jgi:hypothetical protein